MTTEVRRCGRLEAIVLAAGAGARFGGGKLTAPWRGGALVDGALGAALAAPARSVFVVTGADRGVALAASAFAATHGESARLNIVRAADHAAGMSASLRAGLAALPADTSGVFVFLGDMPAIPHGLAARLARAVDNGAAASAPTFEGVRGHPVLFSAALFDALRGLDGDRGARLVLETLGERLALIEAPNDGVLLDVDRPGDLKVSPQRRRPTPNV